MTKTFDSICNKILRETLMPAAPLQKPGQTNQTGQPQTPGQTPAAGQPPTPGQPPAPAQPSQPNPELAKAFETLTKHAANNQDHVKAIAALQQLLTAQQNAANQ